MGRLADRGGDLSTFDRYPVLDLLGGVGAGTGFPAESHAEGDLHSVHRLEVVRLSVSAEPDQSIGQAIIERGELGQVKVDLKQVLMTAPRTPPRRPHAMRRGEVSEIFRAAKL